jgi:transcriptional regulator with XRE-family HTH domain
MIPYTERLAELIRTARTDVKLTVRMVAAQVGISAAMLSRIELAGESARVATLIKLAEVLHLDPDLLLLLGFKLPPDVEQLLFSGDPQPRLKLVKQLRQQLTKL